MPRSHQYREGGGGFLVPAQDETVFPLYHIKQSVIPHELYIRKIYEKEGKE